jgi:steroid delta-isomerase-like uncharacterized protein
MKKLLFIIPLVFLLCFTFSCQDKEAMAELEAMKAQAEVEEQNKGIIKRSNEELWNAGNTDVADEIYAVDYVRHYPASPEDITSRDGLKQLVTMYHKVYPDFHSTLEDIFAEGDKVAARYTVRGTHKGELMGIPPTGNQVTMSAIIIHRFADGKIVEDWAEYDFGGQLQQLGMELKPKEGK